MSVYLKNPKKIFLNAAKIFLSILVLWFLVQTAQIKITLIVNLFQQPLLLCSTIGVFLLMIIVGTWRWQLLNAERGIVLSFFSTLKPIYLGAAYNNLLPGSISGDVIRLFLLCKKVPDKKAAVLISLFFDRFMGFMGVLLSIAFITIFHFHFINQHRELSHLLLITSLFGGIVITLLITLIFLPTRLGLINWLKHYFSNKPIVRFIISFFETLYIYRSAKRVVFRCLIISVFIQILIVYSLLLIAKMMHFPPISFSEYTIAIGLTQIISLIPVTPGGIGVGEMVFSKILLLLNPGTCAAFATIFLAYRLLCLLVYLPGIFFFIPDFKLLETSSND